MQCEENVRKEIVRAVIANPHIFNCFVPDLGEGGLCWVLRIVVAFVLAVLRHRLFIRLDDELDDDNVVLMTARRG